MSLDQLTDFDAEKSVLASLLIDPSAYFEVAPVLEAEDFYLHKHRWIYSAIRAIKERGAEVDYVTVCDELESRGKLEEIGGAAYITGLLCIVPSALRVDNYAKIVSRKATRRRLVASASEVAKLAYDQSLDLEEVQAQAEMAVLSARRDGKGDVAIRELMEDVRDLLTYWQAHPDETRGVATGLDPLDDMLGGLEPGLHLLAARPSLGKTALVLQITSSVARRGERVMFFTLEMSEEQLGLRLAASEAGAELSRLKRGEASEAEYDAVSEAMDEIAAWPLTVHRGAVTAGAIRAKVQRAMMQGEVSLVVVDYLGLMAASKKVNTRNLELGSISRELKLAADDLNVPILTIHQLNRSVDKREDKRPLLSDLRESGRLEEDADVVLMLYRDGYYDEDSERSNTMEIWVRKNRLGGPAGDRCEMYWKGEHMRCFPFSHLEKPAGHSGVVTEVGDAAEDRAL